MGGYSETVRNAIYEMPYNKIFAASELKKSVLLEIPDSIYYKTLERMVKKADLVHLAKGLYYRALKENGEIIPIDEKSIVDYYIAENSGAIIGEGIYIEKHIATNEKKRVELITNKLIEKKKNIGEIAIKKVDFELNENIVAVIQMLEMLQNYYKVENIDKKRFVAYLHDFADEYDEEILDEVLEKIKYKKSTIAFLAMILDWYGISHTLDKYLSTLSTYKIPTVEELKLDIPETVRVHLREYVKEIQKIYDKNLEQVILYGSYAKGNYGDNSDIDIMILVDVPDDEIYNYSDMLSDYTYDFNMEYNLDVKPMTQSKENFLKWVNVYPFFKHVRDEGIKLYGAA